MVWKTEKLYWPMDKNFSASADDWPMDKNFNAPVDDWPLGYPQPYAD